MRLGILQNASCLRLRFILDPLRIPPERERAIRLLLEDDLNVLKDSAKAHIPEHLASMQET